MVSRVLFILFLILVPGSDFCMPVFADQEGNKTLLGIYMVGSDLESEDGSGTDDISEMMKGYGRSDPDILTLLVAYGGAYTPEWSGMTIADGADLKSDLADGIIGNDNSYLFRDRDANMGDIKSFSCFLSYLDDLPREHTYLVFWDHGDAYLGFGYDENFAEQLTIPDIIAALEEENNEYDLIGFDACLMGTIEVATRFTPYTRYFLASEELVPGEGWDYAPVIAYLATTGDPDPVRFGEIVMESFIRGEEEFKTLSLMDLNNARPFLSSLEDLGSKLSLLSQDPSVSAAISSAYKKTKAFGSIPREQTEPSLDLAHLLTNLKEAVPEVQEQVSHLFSLFPSFVVAEKHIGSSDAIGGIAIASPRFLDSDTYHKNIDTLSLTAGWDRFFSSFVAKKAEEIGKPQFIPEEGGSYLLVDEYATADVSIDYYALYDDGILILGSQPAYPDEDGYYRLPDWNGRWYYLKNPDGSEDYALLEMFFIEENPDGSLVFSSDIDLVHNGKTEMGLLHSIISPVTGETSLSILPYTIRPDGDVLYAKKALLLTPGDTLITYASFLSDSNEEEELIPVGEITVTEETDIVLAILPDGQYASGLYAEYYQGEGDYSDMNIIEIAGDTIIQLAEDPLDYGEEYEDKNDWNPDWDGSDSDIGHSLL